MANVHTKLIFQFKSGLYLVRYKFMLLLDWTVDTTVDRSSGIPANLFLHISFKKKFNSLIGVTLLKKSTGNNRLLSFPIYSPGF